VEPEVDSGGGYRWRRHVVISWRNAEGVVEPVQPEWSCGGVDGNRDLGVEVDFGLKNMICRD